jgi:hypothetical protein
MAPFKLFGEPVAKAAEPAIVTELRTAIAKNISERLVKRVNQVGDVVDFKVTGDDRSAFFKTREEAVALIVRATIGPILKTYYYGEETKARAQAMHPAAISAAQQRQANFPDGDVSGGPRSANLDEDYDHAGNPRPKLKTTRLSLWDRHTAKGPMINGARQPASVPKSQRRPRIM